MRILTRMSLALLATLALAACSSGTPTVDKDDLAKQVSDKLAASVGQTPKSVECPDDLVGKVGTTTTCTLTAEDGTTFGVTVTVTGVDGSDVSYDAQVDQTPAN